MIPRVLEFHLRPIARAYQRAQFWRRLALCWAAAGMLGLLCLLVRRWLGLSELASFLLVAIPALIGAAYVLGIRRHEPTDYVELARQIEVQHPELGALLLTAVEQQPQPETGELDYLQQRVIDQALAHKQGQPWGKGMLQQLFRAEQLHGLALVFLVVVLAGLFPSHGLGLRASGRSWAARSHGVSVTPGDISLERGNGLVVLARFDGTLPTEASLVVQPLNEAERRVPLAKNLADPVFGGGLPEVKANLKYRIEFDGGRTRDFKVEVFDYPRLERADADLSYPAYTGLAAKSIPDTRRVSAVEGSTVHLALHLNKAVATAQLVARDRSTLPLTLDTNSALVYHARFDLAQSRRLELVLVDTEGRTNRMPPEFVLESIPNRPPELRLAFPRGDQRVSPIEEISFEAEASDDFGLQAYGFAYSLAGGEPVMVELGKTTTAREKRPFTYLLAMEGLSAQPDQMLSYYLWADDFGPDGKLRRTTSDMFFAEVRPLDEIFREGQPQDGGQGGQGGGGEGQGNQTQRLGELQRQIINATWNLKRREHVGKPSAAYGADVETVHQSQQEALKQAEAKGGEAQDPKATQALQTAVTEMTAAATALGEAAKANSITPLDEALKHEQAAAQALLRLQAHEYQVARAQRQRGGGGGGGGQGNQRQLDQLDLKQTENRYETQSQAAAPEKAGQLEHLQVLNRLKELAQRQQDLNDRLKELQTALQEAASEQEREEIRRRLKRLREEQQEMLADVDELKQRMERPENQSRMNEARQQLDQTRSQVQRAAEALDRESVPQALAAGTRAQRDLQKLQEDFRKQTSSQFSEDMRRMRQDARDLSQKEDQIAQQIDQLGGAKQKSLADSGDRQKLAQQLEGQKSGLTNLFNEMRQVSEQSETAEPLLSQQLYDTLRRNGQGELDQALESSSELLQRGFIPQASQFERRARKNLDDLTQSVEKAAESVLGDEAAALRLAQRELDSLTQDLEKELNQQTSGSTNRTGAGPTSTNPTGVPGTNATSLAQAGGGRSPSPTEEPGQPGQAAQRSQSGAPPSPGQGQPGQQGQGQAGQGQGQPGQAQASNNPTGEGERDTGAGQGGQGQRTGQRAGNSAEARREFVNRVAGADGGANGGGGGGGAFVGPLTGERFVDWSDRLRNVEEMLDQPELRTQVARARDRARVVRQEWTRVGKKPDWAVVRLQIAAPLAEVRTRVAEELARRESKEALVPIDRDPVPSRYSELVRRYYEQLGKSQ